MKIGDADEQSFLTDRINISRKIQVCLQLPEYHFTISFTPKVGGNGLIQAIIPT